MVKAVSAKELSICSFELLPFENEWLALMGTIELTGSIFIWGDSGHGKTSFSLAFAKYISQFAKVYYNSLEEGKCSTQQIAWNKANMLEVGSAVQLLDKEPIEQMRERLIKARSAKVAFVDSFQYANLSYPEYTAFKDSFRNKLFVWVSHADGKKPDGRTANKVRYDAHVKLFVKGFVVFPQSRYGGNIPMIVWEEGARRVHGDKKIDTIKERYEEFLRNTD